MATHTQLPIYKVAYNLLDVAADFVKNMPRDFKRSIGEKINAECLEITVLIFRANVYQDKAPHLLELIERLQVAELLIRLARDKRLISPAAYAPARLLPKLPTPPKLRRRRSLSSPKTKGERRKLRKRKINPPSKQKQNPRLTPGLSRVTKNHPRTEIPRLCMPIRITKRWPGQVVAESQNGLTPGWLPKGTPWTC